MRQSALLARILREFRNHPGIVLTSSQAMGRWGLDSQTANEALTTLADEGFLTSEDGLFFWADAPVPFFKGPHTPRPHSEPPWDCARDRSTVPNVQSAGA